MLETHYESSIFVSLNVLLLKEVLFGSNDNSYTVCTQSDMYTHTHCAQYGDGGRAKEMKGKSHMQLSNAAHNYPWLGL